MSLLTLLLTGCGPDASPVADRAFQDTYEIVGGDADKLAVVHALVEQTLAHQILPPTFARIDLGWVSNPESNVASRYHPGDRIEVREDLSTVSAVYYLQRELARAADHGLAVNQGLATTYASATWTQPDGSPVDPALAASAFHAGPLGARAFAALDATDCGEDRGFAAPAAQLLDQAFDLPPRTVSIANDWSPYVRLTGTVSPQENRPLQERVWAASFPSTEGSAQAHFGWTLDQAYPDLDEDAPLGPQLAASGWALVDLAGQSHSFHLSEFATSSKLPDASRYTTTTAPLDNRLDEPSRLLFSPYLLEAVPAADGTLYGVLYDGGSRVDHFRRWLVVRFTPDLSDVHVFGQHCADAEGGYWNGRPATHAPPRLFETPDGIWAAWLADDGLAFTPLTGPALDQPPRHWRFDEDAIGAAYADVPLDDFYAAPFVVPLEELTESALP